MNACVLVPILVWVAVVSGAELPLPPSGNVTLTLEEYNRLVELANQPRVKPEEPPLAFGIQCAEMKFEVTGESARGSIQLDGEVLSKGEVKVPLVTGMTVFDALDRGQALPLEQDGGTHVAVLTGPQDFSITLDGALPLSIEPGRATLQLPVPAAGAVRLTLVLPGDHTNVILAPGLITGRSSAAGKTTIVATLPPGQPASLWWATRENIATAAPREVRFLSDVKTLVSVGDAGIAMTALVGVTVVQGEPAQFELVLPAGYEFTGATGPTLVSTDMGKSALVLKTNRAVEHQFLISLDRPIAAPKADVPLLSVKDSQRETGEVMIEGQGTMELTAKESGGAQRMDLREASPYLRSLAQYPVQSAFRYHRQPGQSPALALEWVRFPDSNVLSAVAQEAQVTTLVTAEGRSLTEVKLTLKNQAQPFLKVGLPAGATILSAEVAGEKVKPVLGPDGSRVPLLRAGFRPTGAYTMSFVFMHAGTPFAKKGGSELALPKMDVPVGLLQWEVFLPEQYKVKNFGGDALAAELLPVPVRAERDFTSPLNGRDFTSLEGFGGFGRLGLSLLPGQIGGYVLDAANARIAGATVTATHLATGTERRTTADLSGRWIVSNLTSGSVKVTIEHPGFKTAVRNVDLDPAQPFRCDVMLEVGSVSESVEVTASSNALSASNRKPLPQQAQGAPSANIVNLQRRVAGVLPIAVDVPRAGNSYRFVRPLVIDEETTVSFAYRTK
jgi:hypothetical protein